MEGRGGEGRGGEGGEGRGGGGRGGGRERGGGAKECTCTNIAIATEAESSNASLVPSLQD